MNRPGDAQDAGADAGGVEETSTIKVDSETGLRMIEEGRAVMDPLTRQPVKLSKTPEMRLADFSPGLPMELRGKLRLERPTFESIVSGFEATLQDGDSPQARITNDSIDWTLANLDNLSYPFRQALTRMKMKAQSEAKLDEARRLKVREGGGGAKDECWARGAKRRCCFLLVSINLISQTTTSISPRFAHGRPSGMHTFSPRTSSPASSASWSWRPSSGWAQTSAI